MRSELMSALLLVSVLYGCATRTEPTSMTSATTSTSVVKPQKAQEVEVQALEATIPNSVLPCSNSVPNIDSCKIELNVTLVASSCVITMANADDDLIAAAPQMRGKILYWKILTSGFVFTEDDGIDFVDNARPRGFANGYRLTAEPTAYRWKNINRGRKVYGYVINVTNSAETVSCFLDPWVRNK